MVAELVERLRPVSIPPSRNHDAAEAWSELNSESCGCVEAPYMRTGSIASKY